MTIGERIKTARKNAGLTQKQLGELLGISFQAVAQWENDLRRPKMESALKIANALNIEVSNIISPELADFEKMTEPYVLCDSIFSYVFNKDDSKSLFINKTGYADLYRTDGESNYIVITENDIEKFKAALTTFVKSFVYKNCNFYDKKLNKIYRYKQSENTENSLNADLLRAFNQLNEQGQQKAVERVEELTEIPKYKKSPSEE